MNRSLIMIALCLALCVACGGAADTFGDGGTADGGDILAPAESSFVALDSVDVGACGATRDDEQFVDEFGVGECDQPHAMELAGRYQLEGEDDAYPGDGALVRTAYEDCQPIFEKYVGESFWDSDYDIRTLTPSPMTWGQGDREVVCFVVGQRGAALTRSTRAAH